VFGNKNWEQQEQYEKNILTIIKRLPFFLKISSSNNLVEQIIPFFLEDLPPNFNGVWIFSSRKEQYQ
jgi:hypothetical protein